VTPIRWRRQRFDEAADATGRDLRQDLHQTAVDPRLRANRLGHTGGQDRINFVHYSVERGVEPVTRLWQRDFDLGRDMAGMGGKDENAVAHQNRFLDIVGHHQHGLGGELVLDPQVEKVGAQGFGG
jgi:hypothetical protein